MMLEVSDLLRQFFKGFVLIFVGFNRVLPGVRRQKELPHSVQKPASISVVFLVVRVCSIIASPIQSTVVIPNRKDIFFSDGNRFFLLAEDLTHESQKIFSGITVDSDDFVAFLGRELFHDGLDNAVRVLVELLEIVPEIPHDMRTAQNSFQELILPSHVVDISLFRRTQIVVDSTTYKLVLKTMNSPSNMSGKGSIILAVSRFRFPNELSFVLQQNMLIGPFHKVPLNAQVRQNRQCCLRMAK